MNSALLDHESLFFTSKNSLPLKPKGRFNKKYLTNITIISLPSNPDAQRLCAPSSDIVILFFEKYFCHFKESPYLCR